jgi:threonyl-tRNA synthetase
LSASITVIRADSQQVKEFDTTTTTGLELFGEDQTVVALRIDGSLVDLATELHDGDVVEAVDVDSPDGLAVLRHSTAHVAAQAVQALIPAARLGIGPPITDGFYYDFQVPEPFTPEVLKQLTKLMQRIVKERQRFVRRVVTDDEARAEFADEPFKLELIDLKSEADTTEGASVEVGAGELTVYDNVRRNGEVAWKDLCRGPHVPHTGYIKAFALTRSSAAYWRGDQTRASLQRLYGTSWPSKQALVAYQERIVLAAKRDHRKLGTELDLFSFPDEIGSGLAVFHPNGGTLRRVMEDYSRAKHVEHGYQFVNSPHITKAELFKVSGHLDWYADGMYPPMQLDAEYNEDGTVRRPGQDYYLKPMNCPFHCLIYRSRGRSYRELPMRLFEFGTVYRYEKSGVIHGLTRARGFTQDDAHIFATKEQMKAELASLLQFVLDLLADYGLDDFYLELSTKNPDKHVGPDEVWEEATETLRQVGVESGLELVADPGGAAFYGPKISVQTKDALGRTWQMSTIQLDFNEPELFGLEYTAPDGTRQRPIMIHRARFGSVERFIGVLTEHYGGAFPAWLAPVQAIAIPVAAEFDGYLQDIADELTLHQVRIVVDKSDDRFGKKIRNAQQQKVPFMLIAGEQDVAAGAVSFRYRDGTQKNGVPVAEAVAEILTTIADRT